MIERAHVLASGDAIPLTHRRALLALAVAFYLAKYVDDWRDPLVIVRRNKSDKKRSNKLDHQRTHGIGDAHSQGDHFSKLEFQSGTNPRKSSGKTAVSVKKFLRIDGLVDHVDVHQL